MADEPKGYRRLKDDDVGKLLKWSESRGENGITNPKEIGRLRERYVGGAPTPREGQHNWRVLQAALGYEGESNRFNKGLDAKSANPAFRDAPRETAFQRFGKMEGVPTLDSIEAQIKGFRTASEGMLPTERHREQVRLAQIARQLTNQELQRGPGEGPVEQAFQKERTSLIGDVNQYIGPQRPPEFTSEKRFGGGEAGQILGSFGGSLIRPFMNIPGLGYSDVVQQAKADLDSGLRHAADTPGAGLASSLGNVASFIGGVGGVGKGLARLAPGMAPAIRTGLSGGAIGGLTTEGDLGDRGLGAVMGTTSMIVGSASAKMAAPIGRMLGSKIMGSSLAPSVKRQAIARLGPLAAKTAGESLGFTGLELSVGMLNGQDVDFLDTYLHNLAVVGVLGGVGQYGKKGRARQKLDAKTVEAAYKGAPGPARAIDTYNRLNASTLDWVANEVALRKALAGQRVTPQEMKALKTGGVEYLRRMMVDVVAGERNPIRTGEPAVASSIEGARRMKQLFSKDVKDVARSQAALDEVKVREAQEAGAPKLAKAEEHKAIETQKSIELERQHLKVRKVREAKTQEAADVVTEAQQKTAERVSVSEKNLAFEQRRFESKMLEAAETKQGRSAEELRVEGREDLIPKDHPEGAPVVKGNREKAAKMVTKARGKLTQVRAEHEATLKKAEADNKQAAAKSKKIKKDLFNWLNPSGERLSREDALHERIVKQDQKVAAIEMPDAVKAMRETLARILPGDSTGGKELAVGEIQKTIQDVDFYARGKVGITPMQELSMKGVETPEGAAALTESVRQLPPVARNAPRLQSIIENDDPFGLRALKPYDRARQTTHVLPKVLPKHMGEKLSSMMREASFQEGKRIELMRANLKETSKEYWQYLKTLDPVQRQAAIERLIGTQERTFTGPLNPSEARMAAMLESVWGKGGYSTMIERGKKAGIVDESVGNIEGYFPHIRAAAERMTAIPHGKGQQGVKSRFLATRAANGEFMREIFQPLDAYINSIERVFAWTPAIQEWTHIKKTMAERGTPLSEKTIKYVDAQMDMALGRFKSSPIDVADGFINAIGKGPLKFLSANTENPARRMLNTYVWLQYLGGLGASISAPLKNLTQNVNTIAAIGPKWWAQGAKDAYQMYRNEKGQVRMRLNPKAKELGFLDHALQDDIAKHVDDTIGMQTVARFGKDAGDILLLMFKQAEYFNRTAAGMGAYKKMLARTGNEQRAKDYANEIVSQTQFDYSSGFGGQVFGGPVRKAALQFSRFPIYQLDYVASMWKRAVNGEQLAPGDAPWAAPIQFAAGMMALNYGLNTIGIDLTEVKAPGASLPEFVKQPVQFVMQEAAATGAYNRGESMLSAREQMRTGQRLVRGEDGEAKFEPTGSLSLRDIGMETRHTNPLDAILATFGGPAIGQVQSLIEAMSTDPDERAEAARRRTNQFNLLIPGGLSVSRYLRFKEELKDGKIYDRNGQALVELTNSDKWMRLTGIRPNKISDMMTEMYDLDRRVRAEDGLKARVNKWLRDEWLDHRDWDKFDAQFEKAYSEIEVETGKFMSPKEFRLAKRALERTIDDKQRLKHERLFEKFGDRLLPPENR